MPSFHKLYAWDPVASEIARLARVVSRRYRLFVAVAAVPVLAAAWYVIQAPDRYAGTARIIVGKSAAEDALRFTAPLAAPSNELQNQLELIKSREVIAGATARGRRRYGAAAPSEEELARALTVKPLKDTDIIEIRAEARAAARAAALANLVADAYIDAHLRDRRTRAASMKDFVEGQLALYESRLRASERAVEEFKRRAGVTLLDAETGELIKTAAAYETELEKTNVELAVAETRAAYYEKELRRTQARLLADVGDVSSPVAKQLQDKLVALEFRYANLVLKGYSPEHGELQSLAEEIAVARNKLAEEASRFAGSDVAVNPFAKVEALALQLDDVRADVAALRARRGEFAVAVAASGDRLAALPQKESMLADLTRAKESDEKIYTLLLEKREEARIAEAAEVGTARLFSRAMPPAEPFAPRRLQSFILGVVAGLCAGLAAVALTTYFDRTVKTAAAARDLAGAPVLGVIPLFGRYLRRNAKKSPASDAPMLPVVVQAPKSPGAEAFRTLYAQLVHLFSENGDGENITLAFTSARPQEGKSTIAANLGAAFAQFGVRTLLIDADLNRPTLARIYGVEGRLGLADYLRREANWRDVVAATGVPNLTLLTAGTNPSEPPTLLASIEFITLISQARKEFPLVLVDVPPVFPVADVALAAGAIKKFLMVVRAGVVNPQDLERAVHTLGQVGGHIVGVVFNAAEQDEGYGYHYYYRYYRREGREASAPARLRA